MNIILRAPKAVSIIVVHDTNFDYIKPLIRGSSYEIIPVDEPFSKFYVAAIPTFLYWLIKIRSISTSYLIAHLKLFKPKLVLTYIDNSGVYQSAARLYQGCRFFAIQNGNRLLQRDNPPGTAQIFHREFACIGEFEIEQYRKHGAHVETFYPFGTILNALYMKSRQGVPTKLYDVCLISHIRPGQINKFSERISSFEVMVNYLDQYCLKYEKTMCIALKCAPDRDKEIYEWELDWFKRRVSAQHKIFANPKLSFQTFKLSDESRISIAMHSTALREAFGRGNRILACNFSSFASYAFPINGIWYLENNNFEEFEQRINYILGMSQVEWDAITKVKKQSIYCVMPEDPLDYVADIIGKATLNLS
jgi:surface carbohydrate biosynthesis protein